jgi:hypothetical protein
MQKQDTKLIVVLRRVHMKAAGIEPTSANDATDSTASGCENQQTSSAALALQYSDSNWLNLSSIDVTLRMIIDEWDVLPVNMRQAIQKLVESRSGPCKL